MTNSTFNIKANLILNNVLEGDDVFIHGFRLKENQTIEDFSKKLFAEGIKKESKNSILSTIALLRHDRPIETQISNYVGRGKYRVILKIPETIEDLFLGRCKKKYGDAGNQYSENSILDFLELDHIPPEFIVGIVYTDKEMYEDNEEIEYKFIENPGYFDNLENSKKNSKKLSAKIKKQLKTKLKENSVKTDLVKSILLGEELPENLIEILKQYNLFEKYEEFLNQRAEFDARNEHNTTI